MFRFVWVLVFSLAAGMAVSAHGKEPPQTKPGNMAVAPPPTKLRTCMMDIDLFPYWRGEGELHKTPSGINVDMQRRIFARLGIAIEWVRAPFVRCLRMLHTHEVDLINAASFRPEREAFGLYPQKGGRVDVSRRLKSNSYVAYVTKGSDIGWDERGFSSSRPVIVAIERGASIASELDRVGANYLQLNSAAQAFTMLRRNRVNVVVSSDAFGLKYADDSMTRLMTPIRTKHYYLMAARGLYAVHPRLVEQIWDISGELVQRDLDDIMKQYQGLGDWPDKPAP